MAKARQQYFADEITLQKENRDFAIQPELVEKLEGIEAGAQVNVIETVKVNGEALVPDAEKAVDVSVPLVDDTLYSTSSEDALSARQGRILYDYIQNIQSRGRFLSNWNCATGLAMTNPSDNPYLYRTGDYYLVSNVAALGGTNYRPDGSQYVIGQASTTVETEIVKVGDMYIYDGVNWLLLVNTEREIAVDSSLSTTSTNPVENRVITNALNSKQDTLIAGTNIQIAADGKTISATDTTYSSLPAAEGGVDVSLVTTGEKYTWNGKQDKLIAGNNISIAADGKTISAVDTTYSNLPAAQGGTDVSLVSTGDKYIWNNKQDTLIAGTNIQIAADGKTVSATDTTYTAGTNVSIDSNNVISATDTTYTAGANISIDANNEISAVDTTYSSLPATSGGTDVSLVTTGEKYTWGNKQDTIIAGANIQIASDGKTISATDTTYVAGDFDIKDLADSTNLRTTWSGKQDELVAGTNIQIAADGKTISATDTTYTAGANISISNNNVISATDSKAVWGSISGTLADQTDLGTALGGKQDTLIAGTNIQIASDGKTISATDTTYTAGTGIDITNGVISNTQTSAEWGNITGTLSDQTDLNTALGGKQDTLVAGSNIQIAADGYTISATDTTYTAGTGISIDSNNVISNTQTSAEWGNITGTLADQTDLKTELDKKMENLVFLSYGVSTWADFEAAYGKNVYCRASSNSNPAQGDQTRCAFMAYINNPNISSATEVEFQYYRSVATHSDSTQGDEVFVYKLNKTTGRSVTKRNAYTKIAAGTNMSSSYSNGTLTLSATDTTYNTATSSTAGLVKLGSDTTQTESAQSPSSTAGRTYPVQLNSSDQMVVNVPWEDTQTGSATSTAAGTVKLFSDTQQTEAAQSVSSTANRTYGIQNNSSNQMVVNVPWTDTTYGAGTYLTINGTTFDVDTTLIATKSDLANFAGFQVVATLPTSDIKTNIIYLLGPFTSTTGSDKYEEWIYSNSNWIMIGETSVDLSPYFNYTTQTSDAITEGSTNLFLTSAERTKLSNTSGTNTGDETKATIQSKLGAATSSNDGYLTSADWSTFNGKQSALTAGENIDITNNVISATGLQEELTAGDNIIITESCEFDTRGPAPSGFHIPILSEWSGVKSIMDGLLLTKGNNWRVNLHMPFAGRRRQSDAEKVQDTYGWYWAADARISYDITYANSIQLTANNVYTDSRMYRGMAMSIRAFKNEFVVPTSSWTVIQGTLGSAGIFWNQTDGLISITSDGSTGYTMMDKNLGATTVYSDGDTVSDSNAGYHYQWGNNYGFTATGTITNTSSTTVDASAYGPGNYYSSDTFIVDSDWDNSNNLNLWGGGTKGQQCQSIISADLSSKADATDVNTKSFFLSSTSDLTNAQAAYDWYKSGKIPFIVYDNEVYTFWKTANGGAYLRFSSEDAPGYAQGNSSHTVRNKTNLLIHQTSDVVDGISFGSSGTESSDYRVLLTGTNYSVPYTPEYAGSPATKKYVDDSIVITALPESTSSYDLSNESTLTAGLYRLTSSGKSLYLGEYDSSGHFEDVYVSGVTTSGNGILVWNSYTNWTYIDGINIVRGSAFLTYNILPQNWDDCNVTAFTLSSSSDTSTAGAILDSNKLPIVIYNNCVYTRISSVVEDVSIVERRKTQVYESPVIINGNIVSYNTLTLFLDHGVRSDTITITPATVSATAGDVSYSDFGWQSKTGATITLDLASTYTPSANFTVNAPATIKDGQTYILRVDNGATAYTMTLGTNITNPFDTDITLTANGIDQFVFLAIGGELELQPEGGGGGGSGGVTSVNGQTGDVTVQPTLVSGTNIKTINSTSLLGSGNIAVQSSLSNITAAEIKTGTATTQRSVTAAALAGGLIRISSQANNILANGGKLWAGTQANYEALSSYDSDTVYLTI